MEQFTKAELQKLRECLGILEDDGGVDHNTKFGADFESLLGKVEALIEQEEKPVHEMSDNELFVLVNNESATTEQLGRRVTAADELMRRYGILQAMCMFADWQVHIHAATLMTPKKPTK